MAILTGEQLQEVRQEAARVAPTQGWDKAQANAALQAVEDYFENTARAGLGTAIETAAPGVFAAANKRRIVKYYLRQKYGREAD